MAPFSLPAFIKFLLGVFLLQGATALLMLAVQDADLHKIGWLLVSLGILIGVIAALWFAAIASHAKNSTGSVTAYAGRPTRRKQKRSGTVISRSCVKPGDCKTARR